MEKQKSQKQESTPPPQTRYSPETLRKVVELASRIQMEMRETLTAEEVEAIGKEIGLDVASVRHSFLQSRKTAGANSGHLSLAVFFKNHHH